MALDPNATGASTPLPVDRPGSPGRERHEREAALAREAGAPGASRDPLCAPELPGLRADLLFTLIAESVREYAMFLTDADGRIVCWGEGARLMKWWTREQAEGAHLRLLYPDGGAEDGTAEGHLASAAERGEYSGEGHRVRSDGSTFWAYVTLTALRNAEGTLVGFAKVTRDFTARRAVETMLSDRAHAAETDEASARLARVAADVSHEIRTPLSALLGSVVMLEADLGENERLRSHVLRIQRSGRHIQEIVENVLDMSRAKAGALHLRREVNRLGPAVDEALADVEPQLANRQVTLRNATSGGAADLPYVGDPLRVRQILVNLLANAIKFTEPGGHITLSGGTAETVAGISLPGPGPWIYVRVEDTGRGIPPDRLSAIFEAYQQSDRDDQHRGTGLGLSISREFARAMGGDLTATSEVGVGSTFTLWLPIASSEPVPR